MVSYNDSAMPVDKVSAGLSVEWRASAKQRECDVGKALGDGRTVFLYMEITSVTDGTKITRSFIIIYI
jgi:hypothetical protein